MKENMLDLLFETIKRRKNEDHKVSYTAKLFSKGIQKVAQKVGEEAVETVIAAVKKDKQEVISESADLLYHLLVLWEMVDTSPKEIMAELAARKGISGIEEKKNRKRKIKS